METKPFGELSRSEQIKLFDAWLIGNQLEFKSCTNPKWTKIAHPLWNDDFCYRVAATPDSINWDHVHPNFKYLFRNYNGVAYLSTRKPVKVSDYWCNGGHYTRANTFASYKQGNVDWKDSLVERPS